MIETLKGNEATARSEAGSNTYHMGRFLNEVLNPTFLAVMERKDTEQAELAASDDVLNQVKRVISQSTNDSLLRDMGVAFCLSIQAIWERGFRAYVQKCASAMRDETAEAKSKATPWTDVKDGFQLIQGISLSQYPQSAELELLHMIGNACRHGPGKSLDRLMRSNPELWPGGVDVSYPTGPMQGLLISHERLQRFAAAVRSFWSSIDLELYEQQYLEEERQAHREKEEAFRSVDIEVHREKMRKFLLERFGQPPRPADGPSPSI